MKNGAVFTIFKKELARFFKDRRTLIALLMPGFLIYIIYSLMGGAMGNAFMPDEDHNAVIYSVNAPEEMNTLWDALEYELIPSESIDEEKQLIAEGEVDALIIFPENFMEKMLSYQSGSGDAAPNKP